MNLDTAARQPAAGSGGRFYLIGYLPAYAAASFLLLLVWAGAPAWRGRPGHRIRFTTTWATASHLSPGEVVMVASDDTARTARRRTLPGSGWDGWLRRSGSS